MAFVLRRPLTLCSSSTGVSRQALRFTIATPSRAFHQSPFKPSPNNFKSAKPAGSGSTLTKANDVFRQTFRRSYMQETYQVPRPDASNLRQRLLYGAGIVGGTVLAINLVFNRETREDGGMPYFERSYLNETFMHTGLGLGIIGVAARTLHYNGWSYRLMAMNPWVVLGVGLVASIGTMYGTFATSPDK